MCSKEYSHHIQEEKETLIPQSHRRQLVSVCNQVLREHHVQFRRYLNVQVIVPLLNRHNLLSALDQSALSDPRYSVESKVDILLDGLYKCQKENYISVLIQCLRQSAEEAGEAHTDLADAIERHYQVELKKHSSSRVRGGKLLASMLIAVCLAYAVMILTYIGVGYNAASGSLTFPIEGCGTTPIDFLVKPLTLLSTIEVAFERTHEDCEGKNCNDLNCLGDVTVIRGTKCPSLSHIIEYQNATNEYLDTCYLLAHPGSQFYVSLPEAADRDDYHVWITRNLAEYEALNNQLCDNPNHPCAPPSVRPPMSCDDYKESCFKIKDYNISKVITFNVTATNIYCYTLTDSFDYNPKGVFSDNIQFSYKLVAYNFTAISTGHTIDPIYKDRQASLRINTLLNFHEELCPLVSYKCQCSDTPNCLQIVINRKPRMDILILLTFGAVAVFSPVLIVSIIFYVQSKRKHTK